MSLNGLDASAVVEAHQAALAEPGGWFLLKYASRDTVELLSRGVGGVTEARHVVDQYPEKSPLYGLMHVRRKRVMLKYVPVGTSRLLQVRLTVQFQSVLDAFSHDAVFAFTAPTEFSESALNLSAMLQPSAHGTSTGSSAASITHRRLDEISEDAEEPSSPIAPKENFASLESTQVPMTLHESTHAQSIRHMDSYESLPASALKAKALLARRKEAELASQSDRTLTHTRGADSLTLTIKSLQAASLDKSLPATPEAEQTPPHSRHGLFNSREDIPTPPLPSKSELRNEVPVPPKSSLRNGLSIPPKSELRNEVQHATRHEENDDDHDDEPQYPTHPEPSAELRFESLLSKDRDAFEGFHYSHLTTNGSHSISQWNDQVTAYLPPLPTPKKKRAPRPHVEALRRPGTSSTVGIPNTVRASSRQGVYSSSSTVRPGSQQSSRSVPSRFAYIEPVPDPPMPSSAQLPPLFHTPGARAPSSVASSSNNEASHVTPEKMRLMKALQIRKRNMILAQRAATSQSTRPGTALSGLPEERAEDAEETTTVVKGSVAHHAIDHRHEHDSSTASPVSATTSGAHSTKPSTVSEEIERKVSPRASSIQTESSTTPKAGMENSGGVPAQSPVTTTGEAGKDTSDQVLVSDTSAPDFSTNDAVVQLTRASTPEIPETVVQQASPTKTIEEDKVPDPTPATSPLLALPVRSSAAGGSLNIRRNSKHLTLNSTATRSSANVSIYSDDSLMEEIQNATLHEAMPVSVARTPATPTMRKLSSDRIRDMIASPVNESPEQNKAGPAPASDITKPRSSSMKSTSTTQPYVTSDEPLPPLSTKSTLGSSISKRIKALESLTHRDSVIIPSQPDKEASVNKSGFSNLLNRASFLAQFQTPSNGKALPPKTPQQPSTRAVPRERNVVSRPSIQSIDEATEVPAAFRKGETISVTARIVRSDQRPATSATTYASENGLNLHRSPLIVEHERNPSDPASLSTISRDISGKSFDSYSTSNADRGRISFSSHRSGSTVRQYIKDGVSGRSSRMSFMSRKSSRAPSEASSIGEEKKVTRASKLMQRVSGLSSRFGNKGHKSAASRDHLPQQETIVEQVEDERRQSVAESMLQMIDIGDVNVQFPETLIWKRRFMRVDDQGYLIFSAPTDNVHIRTVNRKFHLSELKAPALPNQEREEMLWSIVLDMKDGKSVQCACESKYAQEQIFKMLVDAHHAYNSLYT